MENARERKRMYEKETGEIQNRIDAFDRALEQAPNLDTKMEYMQTINSLRELLIIKFEGLAIASDEIINELEEGINE
ncbi:TPA: hypothetical protein U0Z15_002684 [Listeria monocytogenes]|uniref:Uncharacterized protein n=1 Tax=Listeria monocytogenes TaxID=1639 RepID=A0A823IPE7_LISMN|nr:MULTISPECIES: hypothetical protein [Listeria]ALD11157.1 hypothetical protein LM1816_18760 [Listeria monocytogenes J1-220]EAC3738666.1 hypothetical protein [Listeria monocytogenes]EAC4403332.1 hypothetical protein [Listeria monocytogenes]EAC5364793.1 hypothetical protein [Listeria monocytogenes]EAC6269883.1 hypothetical protein [Listeria monocytogenes]